MFAGETEGFAVHCKEESVLTPDEKRRFDRFFEEHGLSEDIFIYFESLVGLSTDQDRFFFIKAYHGDDLIGLAMFARVGRNRLYNSFNTKMRKSAFLEKLGGMMRSTVYFSMHAVSSPGLPRSFLYTDKRFEDAVNESILLWLREKRDADTVIIFDSAE